MNDQEKAKQAVDELLNATTRVECLHGWFSCLLAGVEAIAIGEQLSETHYRIATLSLDRVFFAKWQDLEAAEEGGQQAA